MKLHNDNADIMVPDGADIETALKRTTHLGIGAHQDDLELGMLHGALECFERSDAWFTGVTCTDGGGSARAGKFADYTDNDMKTVRLQEQRTAAEIGKYSAIIQLGYASKTIKTPGDTSLEGDLLQILSSTRPQVVYTHNPADKHATHVGVLLSAIRAMRSMPADQRPKKAYGVELWRDLDWVPDARKVKLNVGSHGDLPARLMGVFESQIEGGKRYDLATLGRYQANATYADTHDVDTYDSLCYAIDLTPLITDDSLDIGEYVRGLIREFTAEVDTQLRALT